jgi:insulysin
VNNDGLERALDMFSHYFIEPALNEELIEQEIYTIHSEYENDLASEDWRLFFLLKKLSSPWHPFSRFSIGNIQSLKKIPEREGINLLKEMKNYYSSHYSSNLMSLVIIGNATLSQLDEWAKKKFSPIKNNRIERANNNKISQAFFYPDHLSLFVRLKVNSPKKYLCLFFKHQELYSKYMTKPLDFLFYYLGNEGRGSLSSYLKSKGLIKSLSTEIHSKYTDFTLSEVKFVLTDEGIKNITDIVENFFAFVMKVRSSGINKAKFNELMDISKINFNYK